MKRLLLLIIIPLLFSCSKDDEYMYEEYIVIEKNYDTGFIQVAKGDLIVLKKIGNPVYSFVLFNNKKTTTIFVEKSTYEYFNVGDIYKMKI